MPEPSSSVTVKVTVPEGADLTVSPDTLEFTGENWEDAQTVTVSTTEDDDAVSDGVGISHDITGGGYSITGAATVAVTIDDNDSAGVTISPTELAVDEGGSETYTVEAGHGAQRRRDGDHWRGVRRRVDRPQNPDVHDR